MGKIVIRDSKGKEIGYCDENGKIYRSGRIEDKNLGYIENGKIYDKNHKKVGDCDSIGVFISMYR